MDYAIYEDRPRTDVWMKAVFYLPPVLLLIVAAAVYTADPRGALYMLYGALAIALVMGILFFLIMPAKYSVYDSKIKIEFRAPFSFNIPFETIAAVRNVRWSTAGINLPTNMSRSSLLEIARHRRMTVTISPSDRKAFIDNFEKAYHEWEKMRGEA